MKYIKSLTQRKFRQKYNKFIAEGDKICTELLSVGSYAVEKIYSTNEWAESHVTILSSFKEKLTVVTEKDLGRISSLKTANKVMIVLDVPETKIDFRRIETAIYLDEVQDPGNVGTIIRIADWFGISHVIRSAGTADFFSPKVVQSTMASMANIRLHTMDYLAFKDNLPDHTFVGAVLGGGSISDYTWKDKTIIVMGNESKGITEKVLDELDDHIMIKGSKDRLADSLNVGIATSLMCQSWFLR